MLSGSKFVLAALLSLGLSASSMAQDAADRKPLFGELHIHTAWSFDAYIVGVRATPDDAYEFAKGKPLKHPLGEQEIDVRGKIHGLVVPESLRGNRTQSPSDIQGCQFDVPGTRPQGKRRRLMCPHGLTHATNHQ